MFSLCLLFCIFFFPFYIFEKYLQLLVLCRKKTPFPSTLPPPTCFSVETSISVMDPGLRWVGGRGNTTKGEGHRDINGGQATWGFLLLCWDVSVEKDFFWRKKSLFFHRRTEVKRSQQGDNCQFVVKSNVVWGGSSHWLWKWEKATSPKSIRKNFWARPKN